MSVGLFKAGFDMAGCDNKPQPHYPFRFILADAREVSLEKYDCFSASPPCQRFTWAARRWHKEYENCLEEVRERLLGTGKPFMLENVPGSPLSNYVRLNGTMFGLRVIRERWFECHGFEVGLLPSPLSIKSPIQTGQYFTVAGHGGDSKDCRLSTWQKAMGIAWMTKQELTQAIPPAYSEYLGKFMMQEVTAAVEQGKL